MSVGILVGDCRTSMRTLAPGSAQMCVTSPPYFGLRDYGHADQIGLEATPEAYVAQLVEVFREVRRVLRDDGTLWLNLGDSYAGGGTIGRNDTTPEALARRAEKYGTGTGSGSAVGAQGTRPRVASLKPKDLIGIPWRVAFALQADGWYLRSDIIWAKTNPMPESVTDRPTKAHEYLFLLSKQEQYYYDADAIKEASADPGSYRPRTHRNADKRDGDPFFATKVGNHADGKMYPTRNRRTVWTVATTPFSGAKMMADYAGVDGKPYTLSPDCPVHGRHRETHTPRTVAHDGQRDHGYSRTPDMPSDPAQEPVGESGPIPFPGTVPTSRANGRGHIAENRPASKTLLSDAVVPENHPSIGGTSEMLGGESGSPLLDCSPIATPHNSESRRTGRDPSTIATYTLSAQTSENTGDRSGAPALFALDDYTRASNSATDDSAARLSARTGDDTSRTFSLPKGKHAECTCVVVTTDHFATFPPDLIEPCILAGSRRGDTVLDPFGGAGTTGLVADRSGRDAILCELSPAYADMARRRIYDDNPLFSAPAESA